MRLHLVSSGSPALFKCETHNTFVFVVENTQPMKQHAFFRGVLI